MILLMYSIKMRASRNTEQGKEHISGAERILWKEELPGNAVALLSRALHHAKGEPDFVNLKVETVEEGELVTLPALPVTTREVETAEEGRQLILAELRRMGIANGGAILARMRDTYSMRGALLLDVDSLEQVGPYTLRGVRATYMDAVHAPGRDPSDEKNHYQEAIVLATKVVHAPHILGEICISDDPDYVTGYVASKEIGYVRITKLKEMGSPDGGRIFLYRGPKDAQETVAYLEKTRVLVEGVQSLGERKTPQDFHDFIRKSLAKRKEAGLYRHVTPLQVAKGHAGGGAKGILLASNDYLGLTEDPRVKQAAAEAVRAYGTGTGGSRLTTGTRPLHEALEQQLADFYGMEEAMLFATGYMANVGILSALGDGGCVIFSDEKNHASIIDGCRLARAKTIIYRHSDMEDLAEKLAAEAPCRGLIVTDSVFSMDGDVAKLPEILDLAEKYGLLTMVDEAHATGVLGRQGRGIVEHYGLTKKPDILMGTLSKALASEGGYACASHEIIEYLRNTARSFIFSTSQSPANIAAASRALAILAEGAEPTKRLHHNMGVIADALREQGLEVETESAIFPIILGEEEAALRAAKELEKRGVLVSAIRYPTVPRGKARLRIALSAIHRPEELREAAELIGTVLRTCETEEACQ